MCGIVGIASQTAEIPSGLLECATQSLAHRGPDDSGTILLNEKDARNSIHVGLGNRRLAILDISPLGHQPMHDPETGNWIVYNGEIYNFREIRAQLELAGAHFTSHTDTEVVLKSYATWASGCLDKFRGMFAFAIWDPRERQLFLARDHMGIKPLYYAEAGPYFIFGSEVRTLLGTGLLPRQISGPGLRNYLAFGSAYDPLTLVEGIRALPAGHTLTWKNGELKQQRYWDLLQGTPSGVLPDSVSLAATPGGLRTLLEESVRSQLVSDVPLGIFLSGGIDSSALVSIVSTGGVRPSTFSIVFREADYSEAQHSRAIAAQFQTDHHEITVSQADVLAAIPDALSAMDSPTMDGINTFFVSREARKAGIKVALSGLGGDEVFAGYSSFRSVPRMVCLSKLIQKLPNVMRMNSAALFAALTPSSDQNRKLALLLSEGDAVWHPYFISRMLFTPSQCESLLEKADQRDLEASNAAQKDLLDRSAYLDEVNRVSYLELQAYMLNTLLRDADFMSMSQGLEIRVPLIDHQLAKDVLRLPGRSKVGNTPKKLLVKALAGSLPDDIIHRPKRGFTLPLEHWMRDELRPEIESVLKAKCWNAGPLAPTIQGREVERIWQQFLKGSVSWSRPWALFVLHRWCALHGISA